jgi:Fic family protein
MPYIHDLADWPDLRWSNELLAQPLAAIRHRQGRLVGHMEAFGFQLRSEAVLRTLTEDVVKSSEIEGEFLDKDQVRSSIARRLGMDIGGLAGPDHAVDGVVDMVLDATQNYARPVTAERLFGWHAALFPTGRNGISRITVRAWRTAEGGPMQVVSGPVGRERIHFQAPAAERLDTEMSRFLDWFETATPDPVLKAALAHLWFVTIHPFDDGNGRIARAIADLALARADGTAQRFYSMSSQIRAERKDYYDMLEATQKGDLDVTPWLSWFIGCLGRAFSRTETILGRVKHKARFWESVADIAMNERQRAIVNLLLDGFDGKLTNASWATMTKVSPDTALRDITGLLRHGILMKQPAGGRSTHYSLAVKIPGAE